MSDLAMDDLPEEWQEIAKQDGLRAVADLLNQTPATQADVVRIERRQERLTAELDRHDGELYRTRDYEDGVFITGKSKLDELADEYYSMRRRELRRYYEHGTGPGLPLAVIGLVFALVALGLAIYAITT